MSSAPNTGLPFGAGPTKMSFEHTSRSRDYVTLIPGWISQFGKHFLQISSKEPSADFFKEVFDEEFRPAET